MSTVSYHISNLLEKMTSSDKDFRFMATNDLMLELQKDSIKLDEDSERKVVNMLLKLLEDKNGEVQNLAVKCLAPLVSKLKEAQVETMVEALCSNMTSEKEQLRDISSMGLKTVITELSSPGVTMTASVCKKITSQLIGAMEKQEDVLVQLEALDILADMLGRLSGALLSFHSTLLPTLLSQLTSPRMAVRKRSILALGHLVPGCSSALFRQLIEHLLAELSTPEQPGAMTRTCVQCLATVSRQGGHRVGEHLDKLVPLVVKFISVEDDELREFCFQAFEAFISRCPKEMSPHIATVTELCLQFMTFDPNYNYDDDDEEEEEEEEDEEEDMEVEDGLEESDEEYSDDEDVSWKVRRASVRCLEALIGSRRDLLPSFYSSICPALLARFKEREENVRADVFAAFSALLRQTRAAGSRRRRRAAAAATAGSDSELSEDEEAAVSSLKQQLMKVVKVVHRQLRQRSVKARQGGFCLLTELAHTVPGGLEEHIPALVPGIVFSLTDQSSSSTLRMDALSFFHLLLLSHPPQVFQPHLQVLLPPVVACVDDSFYKVASEALLVAQQLAGALRPPGQSASAAGFKPTPFVQQMFSAALRRLKATDIDQEVKESAISCMGHLVWHLGDVLQAELPGVLDILLDRLKNETTRLAAVRTIAFISASPLKVNLSSVLPEVLSQLGAFLRKSQRALKVGALACLTALLTHHAAAVVTAAALQPVLGQLPALLDDSDMHVSQLALALLSHVTTASPASLAKVSCSVLPRVLELVRSPLLQGGVLAAIQDFLQALLLSRCPHLDYSQLLKALTDPFLAPAPPPGVVLHRQAYHSVAGCVAALCSSCPGETSSTVLRLLQEVSSPGSPESARVLALLCLGEVGRSSSLGEGKEVKRVILEAMASPSEEVKMAASGAFGGVTVGGLDDFLPFLLKEISSQPRRQHLLLNSLKEVISACPASSLSPYLEPIWALLLQNCECQEEGTRNLAAECLGKLTALNAARLLPRLKEQLRTGSPLARSSVVTAVRFTVVDQPAPIDSLLKGCIGDFLKTLQDEDVNVRRAALVMFNSAAHNKPSLIRGRLATVLPHLYQETQIRKELIREVEMGPFTHTVDDGLDLRKAAFECMYTLLDGCLEVLDILQFLDHVEEGLKDHYDIRMLTFLMVARLASLCPAAVLQRLDRLIEPLKATCTTKVRAGSVKQEFEKQEELRRSAMRAVAALLAVPEVERSPSMAEFASQIRSNADMASIYRSIQGGEGGGPEGSMDTS